MQLIGQFRHVQWLEHAVFDQVDGARDAAGVTIGIDQFAQTFAKRAGQHPEKVSRISNRARTGRSSG